MSKIYLEKVSTEELCTLGCGQKAKYQYKNGRYYCSDHYNKCPEKRRKFSEEVDHSVYTKKSLETRTRLGITKSSQIKAGKTRKQSGHYDRLAVKMREHWKERPWNNKSKWKTFKDTDIIIQSSLEEKFLQDLEMKHGHAWLISNVKRGPCFYYTDPIESIERLYISDFQIGEDIWEVKGSYTWDGNGNNEDLKLKNLAKFEAVNQAGKNVYLVLDGDVILYAK